MEPMLLKLKILFKNRQIKPHYPPVQILQTISIFNWRNNSYAPHTINESKYDFKDII